MATLQKEKEMGIRACFGKGELTDEAVKMFAKSNLYVPILQDDLVKQLKSMIGLLDSLTGPGSIASEGYCAVLSMIKENKTTLANIATRTEAAWAKIAYFADRLFQ